MDRRVDRLIFQVLEVNPIKLICAKYEFDELL
jgi:hypothetical protein